MAIHMTLLFSPRVGHAVPDSEVEDWFQDLVRFNDEPFCQIGSEILLLRARVALHEKEIDSLTVRYQGIDYKANHDGSMNADFWKAFPDVYSELLSRMVG